MSDREGYLQRRDQLLMQDEEIAELKAQIVELREFAFVCIEMQRAGLSTKDAINSMEAALQEKGE